MEFKKVITSGDYLREYLEHKGSIYEKEYLKNKEPDKALEIEHFVALIKNASPEIKANYTVQMKLYPMPSLHKMVELIEKKRATIYEQLNVDKITGKNAKIKQALALYTYLAVNIKYDMTMQEYYLLKAEREYTQTEETLIHKNEILVNAMKSLTNEMNSDNTLECYTQKQQKEHLLENKKTL